MKRLIFILSAISIILLSLTACAHEHKWKEATCTEPKTCTECGETEGEPAGHQWVDASCTEAKHCSVCGITEGEPLGHDWLDATCTDPVTCSRCGETAGSALGHTWVDATCTEPKTCSVCGATEGEPLGHDWTEATYEAPKTCQRCGETEGDPLYYETPSGFTDGAEFADFDKFNSPASENGLGGTLVWVIGSYNDIFTIDADGISTYCAFFTDEDGNRWLLILDMDYFTTVDKYEAMIGHSICVVAQYEGYSGTYNTPDIYAKQIFDRSTGSNVVSQMFDLLD